MFPLWNKSRITRRNTCVTQFVNGAVMNYVHYINVLISGVFISALVSVEILIVLLQVYVYFPWTIFGFILSTETRSESVSSLDSGTGRFPLCPHSFFQLCLIFKIISYFNNLELWDIIINNIIINNIIFNNIILIVFIIIIIDVRFKFFLMKLIEMRAWGLYDK